MPNFVDDETDLPIDKTDRMPIRPNDDTTKSITAEDWRLICQAAYDLRGAVQTGGNPTYRAVTPQASDPAPASTNYTYVDDAGRAVLVLGDDSVAEPALNAAAFGVKLTGDDADGATNITNLLDLIDRADELNADVFIPPGEVTLGRSLTSSVRVTGKRRVRIRGIRGRSVLRQIADVSNGAGSAVQGLRLDDCEDIWLDGIVYDGGWGNAATTVADGSHLVAMSGGMTIYVESTVGLAPFPATGTFELITESGAQTITYTGKTDTSFTGCTGGSGTLRAGDAIVRFSIYRGSTTVASGSNGASVSASTLNVADTSDFPSAVTVAGEVRVATSGGYAFITYSGKTSTTLTGVSVATGSGTVSTGGSVQYMSGAGDQLPTLPADFSIDPRNHGAFIYGSDGTNATPTRRVRITNSDIVNVYGDGVWSGQYASDTTIENTSIYLCARNGLTLSSFAGNVTLNNVDIKYAHTTCIDSEPVEGPTYGLRMYNVNCTPWPNPGTENLNIVMSIVGGATLRPAPQNKARDWRIINSTFRRGSVLLENCNDVTFIGCSFDNDIRVTGATSNAPVHLSGQTQARFVDCSFSGSVGGTTSANSGVVSLVPYRISGTISGQVHSALSPEVTIVGGRISARGGLSGVFIEGVGGYDGVTATALSYTAPSFTEPSGPNNLGELAFAAGTFTGKTDYYAGRRVMMGGLLATVVANDTDTLYIAPYAENYRQIGGNTGYGWVDSLGRVAAAPTVGTATILPVGGWVSLSGVEIDCARTDDRTAGGHGVHFDPTTTFEEGYNQLKISVRNCTISGATGQAIYMQARGASNPNVYAELELVGNKIRDEQPTKTTTVGIDFDYPQFWDRIEMHGNTITPGIDLLSGHEDIAVFESGSSYPQQYAGYTSPEGSLYAPELSTFANLSSGQTLQKQTSSDYATGWVAIKTAPRIAYRTAATFPAGVQNSTLTMPVPTYVGPDTEFLAVISNNADGAVSLSTTGGFVQIATDTDTHLGATLLLSLFARQPTASSVAPVIDASSGGKFAVARIFSLKDVSTQATIGDIVDASTTLTHSSGSLSISLGCPTSTVANAMLLAVIATHVGSSPTSNLTSVACSEANVIELQTNLDAGQSTLGDRYSFSVITGRRVAAGSMGTLTASVNSTGYAFAMGIALALKPREDA